MNIEVPDINGEACPGGIDCPSSQDKGGNHAGRMQGYEEKSVKDQALGHVII